MTDRVIVKGWRGRLEGFRADLRTRLWTDSELVGLKYDDAFEFGGVSMRRLVDDDKRERQTKAHAAWRQADPSNQAKANASSAAWQKANPDKARAKAARYRESRREQLAIYNQLLRLSKGVSGA